MDSHPLDLIERLKFKGIFGVSKDILSSGLYRNYQKGRYNDTRFSMAQNQINTYRDFFVHLEPNSRPNFCLTQVDFPT